MFWKKRFLLALSLTKMIFVAIFEEIWSLLSSKSKVLISRLFKTPSSRISFYCIILFFPLTIVIINSCQDFETEVVRTIISCTALSAWLIFIVMAVSGRCRSSVIRGLEAELANVQDEAILLEKVSLFADKAKVPKPSVYLTNRPYITAFSLRQLYGDNIIVFNSEILKLLDEDELDSVVSHEIGHMKHFDSILNIVLRLSFCVIFNLFWRMCLNPINMAREDLKGIKSSYKWYEKQLYVIGLFLGIPLVAGILVLAIGIPLRNIFHDQELRADGLSCSFTDNPLALKTAISKLAEFVQVNRDCSSGLGLSNIVDPLPHGWVQQRMFQFLYLQNSERMSLLTWLHEQRIVSCNSKS